MNVRLALACAPLIAVLAMTAGDAVAQDEFEPLDPSTVDKPREDRWYIGATGTVIRFHNIGSAGKRDNEYASSFILGANLSEYFHTEGRFGQRWEDADNIDGVAVDVEFFVSWYIGFHYPISSAINVYGQFGFTDSNGRVQVAPDPDVEGEPDPYGDYRYLEGDFPASGFSVSWIAGADYELFDNTFVMVEYGSLFKDTATEIDAYQISAGFRIEY